RWSALGARVRIWTDRACAESAAVPPLEQGIKSHCEEFPRQGDGRHLGEEIPHNDFLSLAQAAVLLRFQHTPDQSIYGPALPVPTNGPWDSSIQTSFVSASLSPSKFFMRIAIHPQYPTLCFQAHPAFESTIRFRLLRVGTGPLVRAHSAFVKFRKILKLRAAQYCDI